MTGHRGALATMERKLHDLRLNELALNPNVEIMALTRHHGEGATEQPSGFC
ncbi:MAG: hypothetical protein HDS33_06295 [Bacteroides sp.]|nr:hypothetical protein [Bacteroides sp.]